MPLATRPTRRWTVFRESERGITDENRRRIGSCRIHLPREDQAIPERSGARGYGFWNRLGGACRLSSLRPVAVARGAAECCLVLDGSGNGEAMAANRVKNIRCGLCWNVESARLARQHNDANMISLGQRMLSEEQALEIVRVWLDTDFEGQRQLRRIQLLDFDQVP